MAIAWQWLFDKWVKANNFVIWFFRAVAQPGSALRSGRRGRWFESSLPDKSSQVVCELLF